MKALADKPRMDVVRRKLNLQYRLPIETVGRNRGLALLWHENVKVNIRGYSNKFINVVVDSE